MARKLALIIGNSQYEDAGLARLAAPDVDVRALAEVLQTPGIGGFDEVMPLLNEGLATVRKAIARFFDAKHRDDLLVLYFSGHGVRDEQGHLYLAVRDTERAVLAGTAIEASYVTTRMDRSASKRLVLVLDCCHSGAFGVGTKSAQGSTVGTASAFEGTGRGRVVLTATDSTQYAWEGDQVIGDVENSLFTHYLIEGLKSGAADRDGDGQITIDEIYDYVYEHVLNDTPRQTPGKWAFGQQGEIVIASNPAATRVRLPPEIEDALNSKLPSVRLEAVRELEGMLRGRASPRMQVALEMLRKLTEDDSRRVASAADEALKAYEQERARAEAERESEVRRELENRLREEEADRRRQELEEQARREQAERDRLTAEIAAACAAAEAALDRGALDEVPALVDRALALAPDHQGALALRATLRERIEERTRLEEAERRIRELRQRIGNLIARANATADVDEAIGLLGEALGLDPEHAEVKELLGVRYRQRAEAEDAERRARSIEAMKARIARHLERNEPDEAGRALADAAALEAPDGTFAPLQQQLEALIEQRRKDAEEAERRRAVAERRAREEQFERHIAAARTAVAARRFDDAEAALARATEMDPTAAAIPVLVQRVRDGRAELEAAERKRQEIHGHLTQASRHLENGNLTKAILLTDVVLRLDASDESAKTLHAKIQEAIKAQQEAEERAARERERQRQIHDLFASAESAPTHDAAIKILNDLLALDPGNDQARRLLKKRQAELDRAQADERRQEELHARAEAERLALQERAAAERQDAIERALAQAAKRMKRRDYSGALGHVEAALAHDNGNHAALALKAEIEDASRRPSEPSTAFSIRRTLSAPTSWMLTTALRSTTFKVVFGLILVVGIGVSVWNPSSPPSSSTPRDAAAPAAAPPSATPASGGATPPSPSIDPSSAATPTNPPKPTPVEPSTGEATLSPDPTPPSPPARSHTAITAERLARRQLRAGNGQDALKTVLEALAIEPGDAGLAQQLSVIAVDAKKRAAVAERNATAAGSHAASSKAFSDGKEAAADGDRLREALRHEQAARRFWNAEQLFEEAARTPPPPAAAASPGPAPTKPPESTPATAPPPSTTNPSADRRTPSGTDSPKPYTPPAPSPKPPAPTTTEQPSWSPEAARASISRMLSVYEAALKRLDVDTFKTLWSSMPRETEQNLRRAFEGYRSMSVDVSNCQFEFAAGGTSATVVCRERNQIKFKVGNPIDVRYETRFTLRPLGQTWLIAGWSRTQIPR